MKRTISAFLIICLMDKMNKINSHKLIIKIFAVIMVAIMIIPQAGCQKKKDPTPLWDEGYYLDTICRITLYATDDELKMSVAKSILSDAFDIVRRYESLFSKTKEGSDIWRINNANGSSVQCDEETIELIKKGIEYSELSGGEFDITIGGVSELWDFHEAPSGTAPRVDQITRELRNVNYRNIVIEGNSVTMRNPLAQIDLGGIAKGYIADKVSEYLRSRGVTGAVIDLGGNLEIIGYKRGWIPIEGDLLDDEEAYNEEDKAAIAGGTPFVIGIKKPYTEENEIIGALTAADCSVVTSGTYERYIEVNGTRYHHILSTRTGYPVDSDLISVTVIGPAKASADCDAIATICLLFGKDRATQFIEEMPGYGAILIDTDDQIETCGSIPEFRITSESGDESGLTEEGIKVD